MSVWALCRSDNKAANKHTARPTVHSRAPQTHPHTAPRSYLHHQCVAKLPQYRRLGSGGIRRPYSAHCPRTRLGDKVPHRACSAPGPQVSRQRVL